MEVEEYRLVRHAILNLTGVDLAFYKSAPMQRRLTAYLRRSGYGHWPAFLHALHHDADAAARLKDYLTINVSSFFRDADRYRHLAQCLLPRLAHERAPLKVWSAGCARGQEPYSLAMLLDALNGPGWHILATDLDRTSLETAQAGGPYRPDDVAAIPRPLCARHLIRRAGCYYVTDALRRHVTFRAMNLLAEPFEQDFDLIVCRNVVIYFTGEVKEMLYRRFHAALRPGGILFVGGTEVVARAAEIGFETAGISFYRRAQPAGAGAV